MTQPGYTVKTVKAKKVKAGPEGIGGDFIPGLDNAYVVEVRTNEDGGFNETTILAHDAEGNEVELTCWSGMPITIERKEQHG